MIKVIGIDPGVTTGYCYAKIENIHTSVFPFQMLDDVEEFWDRLVKFDPDHIVMEDFQYRNNRYQTGINLFPVQLIGIARLYEAKHYSKTRLHLQSPATGKSFFSDTTLKQMKLHKRGIGHGIDATRHLMQWLTFGYGNQFLAKDSNVVQLLAQWGDL